MQNSFELSEFLTDIRAELEKSAQQQQERKNSSDQNLVGDLLVKEIVLELGLCSKRDIKIGGKISFWVVSADAKDSANGERVHKIKLTLIPNNTIALGENSFEAIRAKHQLD